MTNIEYIDRRMDILSSIIDDEEKEYKRLKKEKCAFAYKIGREIKKSKKRIVFYEQELEKLLVSRLKEYRLINNKGE